MAVPWDNTGAGLHLGRSAQRQAGGKSCSLNHFFNMESPPLVLEASAVWVKVEELAQVLRQGLAPTSSSGNQVTAMWYSESNTPESGFLVSQVCVPVLSRESGHWNCVSGLRMHSEEVGVAYQLG